MCRVGNTCRVVHNLRLVTRCRVMNPYWLVICWVLVICRVRRAHHTCRVGQLCWACRARHTCRVVHPCWSGRRRDHCDSSLLRCLRYNWRQLYITSGHVGRPRFSMLMMSGSRRPDIRRPPRSTARPRNIRRVSLLGPGAGPSRQRRGPGPLPTLSMPRRVTEPWRVVTSLRPVTPISATPFTTVWSMAFRSLGPGRAVGPRSSHHRDAGWNCLRLLVTDLEGQPAESASVALDVDAPWVVTSLRSTMAIYATTLNTVWTMVIWSPSPRRAIGPWGSIYHRHTGWVSLAGLGTWNLEGRSSVALDVLDEVAAIKSCCWRVDPSSSKSRVTQELELRFPAESSSCWAHHTAKTTRAVMRRPAIRSTAHIRHLALLTGSERLSTQVGIKLPDF